LNFIGNYEKSDNQKYIIAWSNKDFQYEHKTDDSSYILLEYDNLLLKENIGPLNEGHVANNGTFIFSVWPNSAIDYSMFYAFNKEGQLIISYKTNALIFKCGISPTGRYAVLQTSIGIEPEDGNKLCLFNLESRKLIWKLTQSWYADSYSIDEEKKVVYLHVGRRRYRYDFQGKFLDAEIGEDNLLEVGSGYDILNMVETKFKKLNDENADPVDFLKLILPLQTITEREVSDNTYARVYRMIGEIQLNNGLKKEAATNFEKALSWNPKIGVKKIYINLLKEIDSF